MALLQVETMGAAFSAASVLLEHKGFREKVKARCRSWLGWRKRVRSVGDVLFSICRCQCSGAPEDALREC